MTILFSPRRPRLRHAALPLLAIGLAACGDSKGPPPPATLTVASTVLEGVVGGQLPPIVVQVSEPNGQPRRNARVSWQVTGGGGSVSAAETVTDATGQASVAWTLGTTVGQNTLSARVGNGTPIVITATSRAGPVASLAVDPTDILLRSLGDTIRLRATAQDAHGNAVANPVVTWSVQPFGRAFINPTGLLRADQPGDATVTATSGGVTRSVQLRIVQEPVSIGFVVPAAEVAAGDSVVVQAIVRDGRGAGINAAGVTWTSIDPSVATVSGSGWVRGVREGATRLRATSATHPAVSGELDVRVGFNLSISGLYITQATQTINGSVPLVAGRNALLRVFVRASAGNTYRPDVRVTFFRNGAVVDTRTLQAQATSVPQLLEEGVLGSSWNVLLPGALIQPGLALLAEVDPDAAVPESTRDDNVFPANGVPLQVDVRTVPTFRARFVPVIQSDNNLMGDVTEANKQTYMDHTLALYPIASYEVDVRTPYTFAGSLPGTGYTAEWQRLLSEIDALRIAEAPDRYYYGVIKPGYTSGGTGLGYIGRPSAIGIDWPTGPSWRSYTAAHEWGHNFGRNHVNCGGPTGVDPNYPYDEGRIGVYGYDIFTNQLKAPLAFADVLSYCWQTIWISDYNYRAVMNFRGTASGPVVTGGPQRSLLVWGRILEDGEVVLEPAFEIMTRPSLPSRAGPNRIEAFDAAGARVFDLAFETVEVAHTSGASHFAFAVPIASLPQNAIAALRLTANGRVVEKRRPPLPPQAGAAARDVRMSRVQPGRVRLEWESADAAAVLVRDVASGAVLTIGRNGRADIVDTAGEIDVVTSDGVASTTRRMRPPQR